MSLFSKIYSRINWVNGDLGRTPLNGGSSASDNQSGNLNKMDYAIDQLDDRVVELGNNGSYASTHALESEGYALGTQDGTEQTSGTYYQNNAKYYASKSSASASASSTSETNAQTYMNQAQTYSDLSKKYATTSGLTKTFFGDFHTPEYGGADISTYGTQCSLDFSTLGNNCIVVLRWTDDVQQVEDSSYDIIDVNSDTYTIVFDSSFKLYTENRYEFAFNKETSTFNFISVCDDGITSALSEKVAKSDIATSYVDDDTKVASAKTVKSLSDTLSDLLVVESLTFSSCTTTKSATFDFSQTVSKNGYTPLGVIGWNFNSRGNNYISAVTLTSDKTSVHIFGYSNETVTTTPVVKILYMKNV